MSEVSVPCAACRAPITFRDDACPACRATIPEPLRDELVARLEASDEDFRDFQGYMRSASIMLLIIACLHVGRGVLVFAVSRSYSMVPTRGDDRADLWELIVDCVIGAAFFACHRWARRTPGLAVGVGLGLWIGLHVLAALASPLTLFAGLWFKFVILFLLGRGIYAALQAASVKRRLATRPRD